jgi:hypothetical protein
MPTYFLVSLIVVIITLIVIIIYKGFLKERLSDSDTWVGFTSLRLCGMFTI